MNVAKTALRGLARGLGYEIHRIRVFRSKGAAGEYEVIKPAATYSPWNKDAAFLEVMREISPFTLVDKYRCFELWKLVEQSAKLAEGDLIEVGVWRGGTGALIARQAANCRIPGQVFLCDTFTGVVKAGANDSVYKGGEHADTDMETVEKLTRVKFGLTNVEILQGIFPDDTGSRVKDRKFRFCHVDVDVYQSAKDVVDWVWPRLVQGGIVVYDDYGFDGCDGVARFVDEQVRLDDRVVLHNLNGHAVVIKR